MTELIADGRFEQFGNEHSTKIHFIKVLREVTGLGLGESRDVADYLVTRGLYEVRAGGYYKVGSSFPNF